GPEVALMEQGRAANESVGSGMGAFAGSLEVNSTIHSDMVMELALAAPGAGLLDLGQGLVNEFLPTEAGVNRHDQQLINLVEVRLDQGNGGGGIDGQA